MNINAIRLNNIIIPNNIFMAPMAGYTCYPFRILCQELGAGVCFTEMVSANALKYKDRSIKKLIFTTNNEKIKAVQLLGNEPDIMQRAACSDELSHFDIIDINMGCPVPNVFKNGEGSALLLDIKRAYNIIHSCKKSGKIISVKFRIGVNEDNLIAGEFAKMCEYAGADIISIHGRSRNMMYDGKPYYNQIQTAKSVVKIPVIANGGIFSKQDADIMFDKTGADGIMIARYGLENPFIFSELTNVTTFKTKLEVLNEQIDLLEYLYNENIYDDTFCISYIKSLCSYFMKKLKSTKKYKHILYQSGNMNEIRMIINEIFS